MGDSYPTDFVLIEGNQGWPSQQMPISGGLNSGNCVSERCVHPVVPGSDDIGCKCPNRHLLRADEGVGDCGNAEDLLALGIMVDS